MTKSQLAQAVSARAGELFPDRVEPVVDAIFDAMTKALVNDERMEIRSFGSFTARHRRARQARNPKTGAPISVPAKRVPFFVTGRDLVRRVNKGRPKAANATDASEGAR